MDHLLSISDLDRGGLEELLDLTDRLAGTLAGTLVGLDGGVVGGHRGRRVASVFAGPGAWHRRATFDVAVARLEAHLVPVALDPLHTLPLRTVVEMAESLGVEVLVVGDTSAGAAAMARRWTDIAVVNGGDGAHQDPTAAIADCVIARRSLGRLDGARVGIVGDIAASGHARSAVDAFSLLGAEVVLVAPPPLLPPSLRGWPVTVADDLDSVVADLDVCLVVGTNRADRFPRLVASRRDHARRFALTAARADRLGDRSVVLVTVDAERGVDVATEVTDRPDGVAGQQVAIGVAACQAVLHLILESNPPTDNPSNSGVPQ